MRRLVMGTVLIAATSTGCFFSDGGGYDGELAFITADWDFSKVNGDRLGCPSGFDTVEVFVVEGPELVTDLYDCRNLRGTADYIPGEYEIDMYVTTRSGDADYAASLPFLVDVTFEDDTIDEEFIDDGGRFTVDWELRDVDTNDLLTCGEAGDPDITFESTITGSAGIETSTFRCNERFGITDPLIAGEYDVSITAKNAAGAPLGEATTIADKVMADRNDYPDLGTVEISIDLTPTPPPN